MTDLQSTIRALHQNARQQTSVAFSTSFTDRERARELRRLRTEARALERTKTALKTEEQSR